MLPPDQQGGPDMRQGRLTESGEAYYHVMSRVVDRQSVLDDDEKERFRKLLPSPTVSDSRIACMTSESL